MKKSLHKDYQEVLVYTITFAIFLLICLLTGLISREMQQMLSFFKYFIPIGLFPIGVLLVWTMVSHAYKKRSDRKKMLGSDKDTNLPAQSFYSYWPYEHSPWI